MINQAVGHDPFVREETFAMTCNTEKRGTAYPLSEKQFHVHNPLNPAEVNFNSRLNTQRCFLYIDFLENCRITC